MGWSGRWEQNREHLWDCKSPWCFCHSLGVGRAGPQSPKIMQGNWQRARGGQQGRQGAGLASLVCRPAGGTGGKPDGGLQGEEWHSGLGMAVIASPTVAIWGTKTQVAGRKHQAVKENCLTPCARAVGLLATECSRRLYRFWRGWSQKSPVMTTKHRAAFYKVSDSKN